MIFLFEKLFLVSSNLLLADLWQELVSAQ